MHSGGIQSLYENKCVDNVKPSGWLGREMSFALMHQFSSAKKKRTRNAINFLAGLGLELHGARSEIWRNVKLWASQKKPSDQDSRETFRVGRNSGDVGWFGGWWRGGM